MTQASLRALCPLTTLLLAFAGSAAADDASLARCHDRQQIVKALTSGFHEQPVSIGLDHNGDMMELFASGESGTWTLLQTRTDGISCVVATGEAFEQRRLRSLDRSAGF